MSRVLPILFNTEMVRAILDGKKSCTRRLVKPQPDEKHTYPLGFVTDSTEKKNVGCFGFGIDEYSGSVQYAKQLYQPGDILYVRETWGEGYEEGTYIYKADDKLANLPSFSESSKLIYHPSIHMPKEAARIWLRVTNVRVERLNEITDKDAEREGTQPDYPFDYDVDKWPNLEHFKKIWNSTIKKSDLDRYGWDASPWVWVVEFERCEKPEDNQN
jgi:hypothetical protein